jgi:hypothetical protein
MVIFVFMFFTAAVPEGTLFVLSLKESQLN